MPEQGPQLISLILILLMIAFWLWMFRDMVKNDRLPPGIKDMWTFAFIFLNIFTAVYYYVTHYRGRR